MKNYNLYIAKRITLSGDGKRSSVAIKIAIMAVALSLLIMFLAISIVTGFKSQISKRVEGFNSHITIYPAFTDSNREDNILTLSSELTDVLTDENYISNFAMTASLPAILKTEDNFKGVYLRGVSADYNTDFIASNLVAGKVDGILNTADFTGILISQKLATMLNLKVGDKVDTYFINPDIRVRRLVISGIFNTHFEDYDDVHIYGNIGLIQNLCKLNRNQCTAIEITTTDFDKIEENTQKLYSKLTELVDTNIMPHFQLTHAKLQGAVYYGWLSLLDTNVIVILILMTLLAGFTLISGMLIIILEKVKFIGIMKAIGASNRSIRRIFIAIAMRIGFIGLVIGNFMALLLLWLQDTFHIIKLDPQSYYIDFVPTEIDLKTVIVLNISVLIIIYLMLLLPSLFVAKISPAKTMHQE